MPRCTAPERSRKEQHRLVLEMRSGIGGASDRQRYGRAHHSCYHERGVAAQPVEAS